MIRFHKKLWSGTKLEMFSHLSDLSFGFGSPIGFGYTYQVLMYFFGQFRGQGMMLRLGMRYYPCKGSSPFLFFFFGRRL